MPRRALLAGLLLGAAEALARELRQERQGLLRAALPSEEDFKQAVARMQQEPENQATLSSACGVISSRGWSDTSKDWMHDTGAVEAVVAALRRFPDERRLQFDCCNAVASMSFYNERNMNAAGEAGAVELVLGAMKRWPHDPEMQKGGWQGCFMDFSYANRLRWQKAGGIEANLESIRHHYNNSAVVVEACYAFSSGTQAPNTEAFVDAGAVDLLVQVMRDHPKGYRVREEIMQAMRMVGLSPKTRPALAGTTFVQEVVTAMRDAPMDFHQQSPGCANIAILSPNDATLRAQAVQAGAPEAALAALRAFPEMLRSRQVNWPAAYDAQYTVYEDCTEALAALVSDPEARARLEKAGAAQEVAGLMAGEHASRRIQDAGARFLQAAQG